MSDPADIQANITGFWSTIASEYEGHAGNVPLRQSVEYAEWVAAIRDLLPPAPADVLDIATGTGFVALIAADLGHRVTGVDASEAMLDEARAEALRRGLGVTFAAIDAVEPSLPESSFDAIISRHFIWTLREPERAFRNWLALLRPAGHLIAIDGFWFPQSPNEDAPPDEPIGLFERHYSEATRAALPTMRLTSPEPIAAMLRGAGYRNVTIGDLRKVHAVANNPPSAQPWYTLTALR